MSNPKFSLGKLHADYLRWHPAQVASKDIDPVYPVLRHVAEQWGLGQEELAWLVFCHVVWYHPGSTFVGFEMAPSLAELPSTADGLAERGLLDLPCETERRGHRPKQPLINHLLGLKRDLTEAGGAWAWAQQAMGTDPDPEVRWTTLNESLTTLVGNGRWAAYKTAEMLQKVCELDVVAADAGHRYSSGPRKGLKWLEPHCPDGQSPEDIATLDLMTDLWAEALNEPDIALVETSLCDFNSLVNGRYYLGHDIDSMQHAFTAEKLPWPVTTEAWNARAEVFDPKFLGEVQGWEGVRKEANRHYKLTGELLYV